MITEEDGRIVRFLEKPTWGEVFSDTINTGIYIVEPEVLSLIPPKKNWDFSKNLFPAMLARGDRLLGYVAEGYWKDVGNLDEYLNVHLDLLAGKVKIDFEGEKAGERERLDRRGLEGRLHGGAVRTSSWGRSASSGPG